MEVSSAVTVVGPLKGDISMTAVSGVPAGVLRVAVVVSPLAISVYIPGPKSEMNVSTAGSPEQIGPASANSIRPVGSGFTVMVAVSRTTTEQLALGLPVVVFRTRSMRSCAVPALGAVAVTVPIPLASRATSSKPLVDTFDRLVLRTRTTELGEPTTSKMTTSFRQTLSSCGVIVAVSSGRTVISKFRAGPSHSGWPAKKGT